MANSDIVYDTYQVAIGIDSDTFPSLLPETFDSIAVNRSYRGGIRKTRPGFREITIRVKDGQDEGILEEFAKGNFQGAKAYRAIRYGSMDGIVCSVAGNIYFLGLVNNNAFLTKLATGNDAALMHTWFCQAEEFMYIQNGRQNAIAWNGDSSRKPTNLQAIGLNSPSTDGTQITTATRARTSNVATITLASDHSYQSGDFVQISNVSGTGYNGVYRISSTPTATSFTYANNGSDESSTADTGGSVKKYLGEIKLTWTDNANTETGYEIQSRVNGGEWGEIATTGPNVTEYIFVGANTETSYEFRVRVIFGPDLASPFSNIVAGAPNNTTITPEEPDTIYRLNPLEKKMPIGTIMEYAYGRVWVSDKDNNIYASDIMFGDGFTNTANVQNFTETIYWNEGGSFTPPSNLGEITGMKVMPSININERGQGELVVLCSNGAFTINGSIDRTQWLNNNIQKVALTGRGCISPWSVSGINNEIFFRSDDGWSLFSNSQLDFQQRLSFRKLSREVSRWVDQDTSWMRQFASAMFFDNRIIATVSPYTVRAENETHGLHRPHRALVVLDLDQASATSPDAAINFRWNGLWTGPRPTQVLTANIAGQERGFVFSFGQDGRNRLFEITKDDADDFVDNTPRKIKSYFTTKRTGFDGKLTSSFLSKSLIGADIWVTNVVGETDTNVYYRPDGYVPWIRIADQSVVGVDLCQSNDCQFPYSLPHYKRVRTATPEDLECDGDRGGNLNSAFEFQLLVENEGCASVEKIRMQAKTKGNFQDPAVQCETDPADVQPITGCPFPELEYDQY